MWVKQSEIRTNGPWRMRTGHANGMRWILGRCAVAHVKAWKMQECENAKHVRYVSMRNVKCAGSWNARDMQKCENVKCTKMRKSLRCSRCQYRVLWYGLYTPVETWVSTTQLHTHLGRANSSLVPKLLRRCRRAWNSIETTWCVCNQLSPILLFALLNVFQ